MLTNPGGISAAAMPVMINESDNISDMPTGKCNTGVVSPSLIQPIRDFCRFGSSWPSREGGTDVPIWNITA
jgi:hypothetical protein